MKKEDHYKTLLVIVTGFTIIGLLTHKAMITYIAVAIGCAAIFIPFTITYIIWGWTKIAEVLGWINSRIILAAFFYLTLTPVALVFRLNKKNPLQLKNVKDESLFITRNHKYTASDLENSF